MPQSVLELTRLIRHTLGGAEPPSETSAIQIINEAGEQLANLHRWNWLSRPDYNLNLTSGQDWIALPSDFAQLVHLTPTSNLLGTVTPTSVSAIRDLRSTTVNVPAGSYWMAVEWLGSAAQAAPTPRLAIWPTPTSNAANAIVLRYRAGWTKLSADTDVAVVPSYCDTLLRQLVVTFARGYVEEDEMSLSERLDRLLSSGLVATAIRRDSVVQPNLGPLRGGAVESLPDRIIGFNPETPIPGPVTI